MNRLSFLKEEAECHGLELSKEDLEAIAALVSRTSQGLRQLRPRDSMHIEPASWWTPDLNDA